jgi:hypothetical protein
MARRKRQKLPSHQWRPADENADTPFVHRVVAYAGPLPRGPYEWRDVCRWLAALGVCALEGRTLRHIPGHEQPKRGRGRPRRG